MSKAQRATCSEKHHSEKYVSMLIFLLRVVLISYINLHIHVIASYSGRRSEGVWDSETYTIATVKLTGGRCSCSRCPRAHESFGVELSYSYVSLGSGYCFPTYATMYQIYKLKLNNFHFWESPGEIEEISPYTYIEGMSPACHRNTYKIVVNFI